MRFELDGWDVFGLLGMLLVLIGLAVWHWPAAVVAVGALMLVVYTIRETRLPPAAQQPGDENTR